MKAGLDGGRFSFWDEARERPHGVGPTRAERDIGYIPANCQPSRVQESHFHQRLVVQTCRFEPGVASSNGRAFHRDGAKDFLSLGDVRGIPAPERAAVNDSTSSISTQTRASSSSTMSLIWSKSLVTSLPDSENHLENRECALISRRYPWR